LTADPPVDVGSGVADAVVTSDALGPTSARTSPASTGLEGVAVSVVTVVDNADGLAKGASVGCGSRVLVAVGRGERVGVAVGVGVATDDPPDVLGLGSAAIDAVGLGESDGLL